MDSDPQLQNSPEKITLDDNARKFTLETIDPKLLDENNASSFLLITDWLETGEENEKKVAHKKFDDGSVQILLITKATKNGKRISEKQEIPEDQYRELLRTSVTHLEKKRYEFTYIHNNISFSLKYDDFGEDKPRVLEVDAETEKQRALFNPNAFPNKLIEVTGDLNYYGFRVSNLI